MKISAIIAAAGLATGINACYITVHSSTVGNFNVQRSEPKDHGGAVQNVSWSKGGCTIKGRLNDGCTVSTSSTSGCGSVSFSITHPGRLARQIESMNSEE